jgi:beta-galactosidase/beta-glucuronidase
MRSVRLRDKHFLLNGEPTYLAMVLDQGYWPDGGMTPPSDEALRADVEWTKQFGFNAARKHQKLEDPRYLYWCDKLGVLVWGEMANARKWSPQAEEWLLGEWERAVRRDYNHPCIVTWVPVNESMGVPQLKQGHPGQYSFIERVVALTRRLDTERPVIDNDGWEHTDVTDIFAVHDYTPTAEKLRVRYAEASQYHGQPVVLSEVGGFLMLPENASGQELDRLYGDYATTANSEELLERYRDLMQGLSELHFICGFCYTQLTDIEHEANGLLSYDRRPKIEPELIAQIHRELFSTA